MAIKSESQNPIIRFTRDGEIEPSRIVAIRALDTFEHLIGQPVLVRYYTSPAEDDVDCLVAIGIKNGVGPDCYHIMSPFDKYLIWGIATTLEEVDVAKFPTGREKYIFIDPETKKAQYVILNKYKEREFIDITDGPRAYEDLSTGRTIYITTVDGEVSVCKGYSDEDIRLISEGKLNIQQDRENGNKVVVIDENGLITFTPKTNLISAGENIEINEDNVISAPNVVSQFSVLPPAEEYNGKIIQYKGQTELGEKPPVMGRFYKSNGVDWEQIAVQGRWLDIIPMTREEYLNADPGEFNVLNLYIIKDEIKTTPTNKIFISDVFADELPEASKILNEKTCIYTGDSNENYLKGRIYRCIEDESTQEYSWEDISSGDAYIHSYQTYSQELPNVNNNTVYVSSYEDIEDMYKRIKKMSSFNGVLELPQDNEEETSYTPITLPIIRVNGLKDMTDENPDKHIIYIDFTVIDPRTNLPKRFIISANKLTTNIPYNFYLTIVQ